MSGAIQTSTEESVDTSELGRLGDSQRASATPDGHPYPGREVLHLPLVGVSEVVVKGRIQMRELAGSVRHFTIWKPVHDSLEVFLATAAE